MSKVLAFNSKMLYRVASDKLVGYTHMNTRVVYNTSTALADSYTSKTRRIVFAVLPTITDNSSQFAIVNNGIRTEEGCAIVWVDSYVINSNGSISLVGVKALHNSSNCSNSNYWPSMQSNALYYRGNTTVYGVSREIHKMGLSIPSYAVAVLVAYAGGTSTETIYTTTVETDRQYHDITDSSCAIIEDDNAVSTIFNMEPESTMSYLSPAASTIYPYQSNRTIVVGTKNSLGF